MLNTVFLTSAQITRKDQQVYNSLKPLIDGSLSGWQGDIKISDLFTEPGIYTPIEEGVYPDAGDLEYWPNGVDSGLLVQFILTDGVWIKNSIKAITSEIAAWNEDVGLEYPKVVTHNGTLWRVFPGEVTIATDEPQEGSEVWEVVVGAADDTTYELATSTEDGLMSKEDKTLIDKIIYIGDLQVHKRTGNTEEYLQEYDSAEGWVTTTMKVDGIYKGVDNPAQADLENKDNWSHKIIIE